MERESDEGTEWIVGSESVAITALGFEIERDLMPGEAIFISSSGHLFSEFAQKKQVVILVFLSMYILLDQIQ